MITDCHAHIRRETEAPPPTLPMRNRDLVKYRALLIGYEAASRAQASEPNGTLSFDAWSAAVDLTFDYIRVWNTRRSALDEVL